MSIGGRTYGEPVLAKHNDGHLEVFAFGTDGHLYRKAQGGPNQPFSENWTGFPTDFHVFAYSEEVLFDPLVTRISWARHQNGSLYVFARTVRGRLVFAHTEPSGGYSVWKSVSAIQDGHPALGSPAATSAASVTDTMLLAVRARNGAILTKTLAHSVDDWGDANRWFDHGGILSGDPVVGKSRSDSTFQTSIYARGLDNNLWWIGETVTLTDAGANGVPFGAWLRLFDDTIPGAKLSGHPVMTRPSGSVVWRGVNGNLWTMSQRSFGVFTGPFDLGLASASDPAIASFGNTFWLFWQSSDGQLMKRRQQNGGTWEDPVSLTDGLSVRVVSKPSASTSADGRAEVIFVGSDAAVYHMFETAVGSNTYGEGR